MFASTEFVQETQTKEKEYFESLEREITWKWPRAALRKPTQRERYERLYESAFPQKHLEQYESRVKLLLRLETLSSTVLVDARLATINTPSNPIEALSLQASDAPYITKRQRKKLLTMKSCCRFYFMHGDFLKRNGIDLNGCVECMYESRLQWMKQQWARAKKLAMMLAEFGPFRDGDDDGTADELANFTDIHYTGDVLGDMVSFNLQGYKTAELLGHYVFTPIGMLSARHRRYLLSTAKSELGRDWAFSDLIFQLCGADSVFDWFTRCVTDGKPQKFESFIKHLDPRRSMTAVDRILAKWRRVREELSEFDLESLRIRITNMVDEECGTLSEDDTLGATEAVQIVEETSRRERRRGPAQLVDHNVKLPPEVLELLRKLNSGKTFDLKTEVGWTRGKETSWTGLIYRTSMFAGNLWATWPNKTAIATAFGLYISTLPITDTLMEWLVSYFNLHWNNIQIDRKPADKPDGNNGPAQMELGGENLRKTIIFLCSMFVTVVTAVILGKKHPNGDFMNTIKNIGFTGRAISGAKEIQKFIMEMLDTTFSYIKHKVFKYPDESKETLIDAWCTEVESFKNTNFEAEVKNNSVLKEKIDTLINRGNGLLKLADRLRLPAAERTRLTANYSWLMTARGAVATSGAGLCESRIAPIIVHLVGASGVGKSSILWPLIAELLVAMGCRDERDINEKVFFKYPTKDERWDGFTNQTKIVVCDDVFSRKDTDANPSPEVIETIRMSNTAFWQLAMAHLTEKGTTFFKAPVVLWTSNDHQFHFESLTNSEAVERRITVRYRQRPKQEYSKIAVEKGGFVHRLDQDKVAKAMEEGKKITDFVVFDKEVADLKTRQILKAGMTFEEMASEVVAINAENIRRGERFNHEVNSYFVECAKKASEKIKTPVMEDLVYYEPTPEQWSAGEIKLPNGIMPLDDEVPGPSGPAQMAHFPGCQCDDCIEEIANAQRAWSKQTLHEYRTQDFARFAENHGGPPRKTSHYPAESKLFWFDEYRWWSLMAWCNKPSHLNIEASALSYGPGLLTNSLPSEDGPFNYTYHLEDGTSHHLHELKCVEIKARLGDAFMKSWTTARTAMDAEVREEEKLRVFDLVFWHTANIPPTQIKPCTTHQAVEGFHQKWSTLMLKFRKRIGDEQYAKAFGTLCWAKLIEAEANHPYITYAVTVLGLIGSYFFVRWLATKIYDLLCRGATAVTTGIPRLGKKVFRKSKDEIKKLINRGTPEGENLDFIRQGEIFDTHLVDCDRRSGKWSGNDRKERLKEISGRSMNVLADIQHIIEARCVNEDHKCCRGEYTNDAPAEYGDSTKGRSVKARRGIAQLVKDQNAHELGPIIFRNLYRLQYQDAEGWKGVTQFLFIRGRLGITNAHVTIKSEHRRWRLKNQHMTSSEFDLWKCCSARSASDEDLMMFEMPTNFMQHPSIMDKFMIEEDFLRFTSLGQLALMSYDAKTFILRQMFTSEVRHEQNETFDVMHDGATWVVLGESLQYALPTTWGDCGGTLIAYDPNFRRKIVGIHAAGWSNEKYTGIGQKVTQEKLVDLMSKISVRREDSFHAPDIKKNIASEVEMEVEGDIIKFINRTPGFTPGGEAQSWAYQPTKSNVYPSRLHNVIQVPKTKPAHLKPFRRNDEIIRPMELARSKASGFSPVLNERRLDACINDVKQMYERKVEPRYRKVFAWEVAIAGELGDPFLPPLNRRTSPGYGWPKTGIGKTEWLGSDDYRFDHPDLIKSRDELMRLLRRGHRVSTPWTDTLKDERRPIAKVDEGKTRMFSVGEMTFVLIFRQYFMGFVAHVVRNRIDNESCVGINVFSQEWTILGRRLQSVGPHVIAGDFTNYDGTLNAEILWRTLDVIQTFYVNDSPEDKKIRALLWSEIANSIHVCGNQLYMWNHSNPSGCPITTVLNSVYHSIAARYVFLTCARSRLDAYNLSLYREHVRHNNYGDDDVWNISEEILPWFNQLSISDAFREIGMTYTDELKSQGMVSYRTLSEIRFLKRAFRWDSSQSRFRAPLSLDTILEMPMWVRGKVDQDQITSITLQEAAHELAQYDRATFDYYINTLERGRVIIHEIVPTYFETYAHYQEIEDDRWGDGAVLDCAITNCEVDKNRNRSEEKLQPSGDEPFQLRNRGSAQLDDPNRKMTTNEGNGNSANPGAHDTLLTTPVEVIEEQQIVTFSEDGHIADTGPVTSRMTGYQDLANDSLTHTVKDFLERPIPLFVFGWGLSQTPRTILKLIHLPWDWASVPMIQEKLAGFRYLRCTFEFRLQVNAQPSNAGAVIMAFVPFQQQVAYSPVTVEQFTGFRHVLLDINQATTATLEVPYIQPEAYFDLTTKNRRLGSIEILVFSQLRGGSETSVDCTLFMRAKDVIVTLPTGVTNVSPAALLDDQKKASDQQSPRMGGPAQAGRSEKEIAAPGAPISAALKATSTIAGTLGDVPIIGSVAQDLSWFTNMMSGVAGIFGWSRPSDTSTTQTVQQSYFKTMGNYAGDCKSKNLGLDPENQIKIPTEFFQTECDEMAFSHMFQIPLAIDRFTITKNTVVEQPIWQRRNTIGINQLIEAPVDRINPAYVDFVGSSFQYWRGELIYLFKIFKTAMHSVRMRITYVPGRINENNYDVNKCYNEVFDIRERNDITFKVPFAYHQAWCVRGEDTGHIVVDILNGLRNPSICADEIEVVVYKYTGPDFQVAVPSFAPDFKIRYHWDYNNSEVAINLEVPEWDGVIQGLPTTDGQREGDELVRELIPKVDVGVDIRGLLGKKKNRGPAQMEQDRAPDTMRMADNLIRVKGMPGVTANAITFGEAVTSFRQVLKRYELYSRTPTKGGDTFIKFTPHLAYQTQQAPSPTLALTWMGYASLIYRFQCGSVRVGFHAADSDPRPAMISWLGFIESEEEALLPTYDPTALYSRTHGTFVTQSEEAAVELQVPHYLRLPVRLTPAYMSNNHPANIGATIHTGPQLDCLRIGNRFISRSIGEDFSFGYLLPPPQMEFDT